MGPTGRLRPAQTAFPLDQIAGTAEPVESRRNLGRVVVDVRA